MNSAKNIPLRTNKCVIHNFFQVFSPGAPFKYQTDKSAISWKQRRENQAHIIIPPSARRETTFCSEHLITQQSNESELIEDYNMFDPWEGRSPGGADNVGADLAPATPITPISETVMRNSLRNQQLMEMRQIVMEVVNNEKSINSGQMHTLLCHRRFIHLFFELFTEGKGDSLCQEKWLDQMKQWTGVSFQNFVWIKASQKC